MNSITKWSLKKVIFLLFAAIASSLVIYNFAFDKTTTLNSEDLLKEITSNPDFLKYFGENLATLSNLDSDNDGTADVADRDIDNDGIPNTSDPDVDGDGTRNEVDPSSALVSLTAVAGLNGQAGADGVDATGLNGSNGQNGATGSSGAPGLDGSNGTNGSDGANGSDGTNGANGSNGVGETGPQGPRGFTGAQGAAGPQGPQGSSGTVGVVTDDGTAIQTTLTGSDLDIQLLLATGSGLQKLPTGLSLTTTCSNNELLKWNGSAWSCGTDDGGISYTAGGGISIAAGVISSLLGTSIDSAEIVDGTISAADIADGSVTLAKLAGDSVNSSKIVDGSITSTDLSTGVITTATISDGAVTSVKVADGAITVNKIASDAVTSAKIVDGSVSTADLADASVTNVKLAADSVTTGKITDGTIASADLADGLIITAKLADGSVGTAKIADNAVTTLKIADANVTAAKLADGSVTLTKLAACSADGNILTYYISDPDGAGALTVGWNCQTPTSVEGDGVIGNEVTDATASGGLIRTGSGTAGSPYTLAIDTNGVTTARINTDAVTSAKILDGTIATGDLADLSITTLKLAADAVTSAKILDGTISFADIGANACSGGQIIKYNGSAWACSSDNGLTTLSDGKIYIGNGSNLPAEQTLSGDATLTNAGVLTIAANAVTSAKIADDSIMDADINSAAAISLSKLASGTTIVTSLGTPTGSNANGGSIASNTLVLSLADATNPGLVSTGTQAIAGAKTFSSAPTFSSLTPGSVLFTGAGGLVSEDNTKLFWDDTNNRLGLGTTSPQGDLSVQSALGASQPILEITKATNLAGTTWNSILRVDGTTGYLGVGEPVATNRLHVATNNASEGAPGTPAGRFEIRNTWGNNVFDALRIDRTVSGDVGADANGVSILFKTENNAGTSVDAGRLAAILQDASAGAEQSGLTFQTRTAGGALTEAMRVLGVNVGIGAVLPNTRLDVNGSVAHRKGTDYATTGSTNDVNFGDTALVRLTGASAQTITGIAGGVDGRILTIVNAGTATASLTNDDAASLAANRITTGTSSTLAIAADASVNLVYDSAASKWRVVGGVGGAAYANADVSDKASGGAIGTAASTVDVATNFNVNQTTVGQTLTIPSPTNTTTTKGKIITINNIGTANFTIGTVTVPAGSYGSAFVWNGTVWNPLNAASNVASEIGSVVIPSQSTSSSSDTDVTGSSFTLPSAGTWSANVQISERNTTASGVRLWISDNSNNPLSGTTGGYLDLASGSGNSVTQSFNVQITTTGSATYKLRWKTNGSGTAEIFSSNGVSGGGSSTISYQKISGNIPVAGQSVDYVRATQASNQNPAVGSAIDYTSNIQGNITHVGSGRYRLTAGKTYQLSAAWAPPNNGGANADYQWYNVTASAFIGTEGSGGDPAGAEYLHGLATAIITPTVATDVEVRYTFDNSGTSGFAKNWMEITQLGSTNTSTGVAMSTLTAALATNALDNTNYAQTWNWSTATTETGLTMTAGAITTGTIADITTSSASLNSTNGLLRVANLGASTSGVVFRAQSNSTAASGLTVLANGTVGIGTTSPVGSTLEVKDGSGAGIYVSSTHASEGGQVSFGGASGQSVYAIDNFNDAGAQDFRVLEGATVRAYMTLGANGWVTPSDRRLKENILTLDNVLEKLDGVRGTSYRLKDSGALQIGVIAQEFKAAFPGVVNGDEEAGMLGVNYDSVAAIAIQAIKELNMKVDAQSVILDGKKLEGLTDLQKQVDALTAGLTVMQGTITDFSDALGKVDLRIADLDARLKAMEQAGGAVAGTSTQQIVNNTTIVEDKNQLGEAKISKGKAGVKITFKQPFDVTPVVYITPTSGKFDFTLIDVTAGGFTLKLNEKSDSDVTFNWLAAQRKADQSTQEEIEDQAVSTDTVVPVQSNTLQTEDISQQETSNEDQVLTEQL